MADATDVLAGTNGVAAPDPAVPLQLDQPSAAVSQMTAPQRPPAAPVAEDPLAQFGGVIPSESMPRNPDIERDYHESTWHRILDRVGTILGGGESIHYTKDADGNVSIAHTPSTTGEKWGRVAAAALAGAGAGLANSQGPGGLARAAGAGIQTGMEMPRQQRKDVEEQATAEQKRMEANANNAMAHQKQYQAMLISQQLKTTYDEKSAALMNDFRDDLDNSPDSKDYGIISGPDDLMRIFNENQDFFKAHTDYRLKVAALPKKGGGTELHAIATDPGDDALPVGQNSKLQHLRIDVDPTTHKITLGAEPVSPSEKRGKVRGGNQVTIGQFLELTNKQMDAQTRSDKANQDKAPKTYQEAYSMAAQSNDPTEKKNYTALGDKLYRDAQGLRAVTQVNVGSVPQGTTPAQMITEGGVFGPQTVNGINAQKLASGDVTLNELPKRMAKGAATPQEMVAAAEQYSQQFYGLPYSSTMIGAEKKQFDSLKEQGILDGIDKMAGTGGQPGYLDTVVKLGQQAGIDSAAPWNEVTLAVKRKLGDQAAKNFNTALGEVQRSLPTLIGNPLIGGSDSDIKLRMAQDMFGKDVTAGNLMSTAETLRGMLNGSKDSLTRNNRFFQRRYGLKGPYAAQGGGAKPPTGGGGAAPQVPPTKFAVRDKDKNLIGYADDTKGTNYHAF